MALDRNIILSMQGICGLTLGLLQVERQWLQLQDWHMIPYVNGVITGKSTICGNVVMILVKFFGPSLDKLDRDHKKKQRFRPRSLT